MSPSTDQILHFGPNEMRHRQSPFGLSLCQGMTEDEEVNVLGNEEILRFGQLQRGRHFVLCVFTAPIAVSQLGWRRDRISG